MSQWACAEWMNLLWPYWALYELTDTYWVTNIILTIYCLDQSPAGNHSCQQSRKWQRSCEHQPCDAAWGTADSTAQCVRPSPFYSRWSSCVRVQRVRNHWDGVWWKDEGKVTVSLDVLTCNAHLCKPVWD